MDSLTHWWTPTIGRSYVFEEIQQKRGDWVYPDPELGCQMELSAGRALSARAAEDRGLGDTSRDLASQTEYS